MLGLCWIQQRMGTGWWLSSRGMTPSDLCSEHAGAMLRLGWKGEMGGTENSEEAVGMVQQEVLEPQFRQEQRPWVKLEPIPEAVLSHSREAEWTGVDSSQKPHLDERALELSLVRLWW